MRRWKGTAALNKSPIGGDIAVDIKLTGVKFWMIAII